MRSDDRRRATTVALAVALLATSLAGVRAGPKPTPIELPPIPLVGDDAVAAVEAAAGGALDLLRPAVEGVRVALLSSGVDVRVLPESLAAAIAGHRSDAQGYGTYTASVLLQLLTEPEITSTNVFNGDAVDAGRVASALRWIGDRPDAFDVVVLAFPPRGVLDPVNAFMAAGVWDELMNATGDHPAPTQRGTVFGVAMDDRLRRAQTANAPAGQREIMDAFAREAGRWHQLLATLEGLSAAGVPVVAPAGDLGPHPQTIDGIAMLPTVITAGGASEGSVSTSSGSGPSLDGAPKPDLVAPTGFAGLLPPRSVLATQLAERGLLDPTLELDLDDEPRTDARTRLDTTITAAAVTAASAGAVAHEGLSDARAVRGALVAASVPLAGEAVIRQGAGLLRAVPTAGFARSRPIALEHAALGSRPDRGPWTASVPFANGSPDDASAAAGEFVGLDPDGRAAFRAQRGDADPAPVASVTNDGVQVTLPTDGGSREAGVYCGYTEVMLPVTGGTIDASVGLTGVPAATEDVPTCLVQGTVLRAHGFYIHDLPAEDLTFSLLPDVPAAGPVLNAALMILPVNPLKMRLFTRVTGADGNAWFPNVPPGLYTVRQFSDYGSPITQTLRDATSGADVIVGRDIGENPSYQDFDALILSATGWTEADLRERFGEDNVRFDPPTLGYLVTTPGGDTIRVVLGELKKMPGPAVSSRYVDLLSYDDLDFNATSATRALRLPDVGLKAWTFAPAGEGIAASMNPLVAAASEQDVIGIGAYPFNLTTPNYTAHMSLNFSYEVHNAAIVAVVQVGDEVAWGAVTPVGTLQGPTVGPFTPLGNGGLRVSGHATGLANFEFELLPRGASAGTLYLVFVPSRPVQALASPLTTATVDDMSFELDTWQRTLWPATFNEGHGQGHAFSFDPNYSPRQMSADGCRTVSSGGLSADVCESWSVMIHSPGDDAATVDLHDTAGSFGDEIASAGAVYADPRRGTADFSTSLAFVLPAPDVPAELSLDLSQPFRTNGRFWEQLVLPRAVLEAHPDAIRVEIVDNLVGRSDTLAPHVLGPAPVEPYVPFVAGAVLVEPVTVDDALARIASALD